MHYSKRLKALLVMLPLTMLLGHTAHAASYTVASGDSLYTIGKLFNTTADTIMQNNNLSGTVIYPGQVLNVSSDTYTVKAGDSIYLIAKKYGLTVSALRTANNIWSNTIYPGQQLVLPGIKSSANTAAPSVSSSSNTSGSVISYTESDLDLLSRLIMAEAGNQPYSAKVGVGAVVINRVKSQEFPNTISGVIYERDNSYYQFTPVENGYIYKPADSDAIKAAYDALHGSDPTHGALYYFDDSATNKWLWSKPLAARIGRMVYVY